MKTRLLVDKVAEALYVEERRERPTGATVPWERLHDQRRAAYVERVRAVLLAAWHAGFIVTELSESERLVGPCLTKETK